MKLQHKHKQLIALAIGLVIVVFGLLQALLKFKIDAKVVDEITMVLFVLAFALLFSGRSRRAGGGGAPEQTGTQNGQDVQDGRAGRAGWTSPTGRNGKHGGRGTAGRRRRRRQR